MFNKMKKSKEIAERCKKAYLDMLIVFVEWFMLFELRHSCLEKHCDFFNLANVCLSFRCCAPFNQ